MVGPSNPQKKSKQIQEMGSHYDLITSLGASLEPVEVEPQQVFFWGSKLTPILTFGMTGRLGYRKTDKI